MERNQMEIFALLNISIDACDGHVVFNRCEIKSASTGDDLILQDGTTRHVADILDDEDLARKVLSAISIKISMKRSTDNDFQEKIDKKFNELNNDDDGTYFDN